MNIGIIDAMANWLITQVPNCPWSPNHDTIVNFGETLLFMNWIDFYGKQSVQECAIPKGICGNPIVIKSKWELVKPDCLTSTLQSVIFITSIIRVRMSAITNRSVGYICSETSSGLFTYIVTEKKYCKMKDSIWNSGLSTASLKIYKCKNKQKTIKLNIDEEYLFNFYVKMFKT